MRKIHCYLLVNAQSHRHILWLPTKRQRVLCSHALTQTQEQKQHQKGQTTLTTCYVADPKTRHRPTTSTTWTDWYCYCRWSFYKIGKLPVVLLLFFYLKYPEGKLLLFWYWLLLNSRHNTTVCTATAAATCTCTAATCTAATCTAATAAAATAAAAATCTTAAATTTTGSSF